MSGRTSDEEEGGVAGKGRRTRPWGQLRGPCEEADELAGRLREWLDGVGLRLDDLMVKLTPDHFENKTVPARSTVADRLAGVNLRWDFVEAVADVCFSSQAERAKRLKTVRPLFEAADRAKRSGAAPRAGQRARDRAATPSTAADGGDVAAELIGVQRQSLARSDQLLRALQRTAELEKARNDANQMVLILLALVDKLHRDIATLNAQRNRGHVRAPGRDALDEVHEKLQHSEAQRTQAEAELARARAEREKADRLAERSAEQVRRLTEELALLRSGHVDPAAEADAPRTGLSTVSPATPDIGQDDVDVALMKASRILDNGAERLEQLAEELHGEPGGLSGPDNPVTSADVSGGVADNSGVGAGGGLYPGPHPGPDNSPGPLPDNPDAAHRYVPDPIGDRIMDAAVEGGQVHAAWLRVPGQEVEAAHFVSSIATLRNAGAFAEASSLLFEAGAKRSAGSLVEVLRGLRSNELHVVVAGIGAERGATPFHELVAQLRAAGQQAVVGMVLTEAGRRRAIERLPLLLMPLRAGSADSVLILKGVCVRPKGETEAAVRALDRAGMRQEAEFLRIVSAGPASGQQDEPWFGSSPRPEPEPRRTTPVLTTRVRINIPGSRFPQPPFVVRRPLPPVEDDDRLTDPT